MKNNARIGEVCHGEAPRVVRRRNTPGLAAWCIHERRGGPLRTASNDFYTTGRTSAGIFPATTLRATFVIDLRLPADRTSSADGDFYGSLVNRHVYQIIRCLAGFWRSRWWDDHCAVARGMWLGPSRRLLRLRWGVLKLLGGLRRLWRRGQVFVRCFIILKGTVGRNIWIM